MPRPIASDHGFSLVELMVVVLIIGVLVTMAIAVYATSIDRASRIACGHNQRAVERSIEIYRVDNGSANPTSIDDLVPYVDGGPDGTWCPSDPTVRLILIPVSHTVTCPLHP